LNRNEKFAYIAIIILAIAIVGVAIYDFSSASAKKNVASENSFDQQPVVDVIIPSLFIQSPEGGVNGVLNLTAGQTKNLTIELYPTVPVNLSMEFRYFLLSGYTSLANETGVPPLHASFSPPVLVIGAEAEKNCSMHLSVSSAALLGPYTLVVSAVNSKNASQIWGVTLTATVSGPA
jgi:hypothetical protein